MLNKLTLSIVGDHTMNCAGCENSVNFTLSMMPGIESVSSDWKTQIIKVDMDAEKVTPEKIVDEMANIDYQVELVD
ncbi:MAG: heavy-metal-associated domain-containing protein [Chloroflexi bacterium]|nr:heavy-metal-associated domain-containing protein [Chloroflexota bacterium]